METSSGPVLHCTGYYISFTSLNVLQISRKTLEPDMRSADAQASWKTAGNIYDVHISFSLINQVQLVKHAMEVSDFRDFMSLSDDDALLPPHADIAADLPPSLLYTKIEPTVQGLFVMLPVWYARFLF